MVESGFRSGSASHTPCATVYSPQFLEGSCAEPLLGLEAIIRPMGEVARDSEGAGLAQNELTV